MDQFDLTKDQLAKMQAALSPALGYLTKLQKRIDANSFPLDDHLRRDVGRAQAAMQGLLMHLHYLGCNDVGMNRPKK